MCQKCNLDIKVVNSTNEQCVIPVDDDCFVIFRFELDEFTKNETFYIQGEKRKL